jgi:hypothetical protein
MLGGLQKDGQDDIERRKLLPLLDSNSAPSAVQPLAKLSTDYTIPSSQY